MEDLERERGKERKRRRERERGKECKRRRERKRQLCVCFHNVWLMSVNHMKLTALIPECSIVESQGGIRVGLGR